MTELFPSSVEWFSVITLLWPGLLNTLWIAAMSLILSLAGGVLYAVASRSRFALLRLAMRLWLEAMRAIPLLVWLFLVFFGLPLWAGIDFSGSTAAILVFGLWGSTEAGEVFRGALRAFPEAQWEAAACLGLSERQIYRHVVIPLLIRQTVPPLMNVATRLIKTTSLTILISVVELTKAGQQIIERDDNALFIYGLLFILYFLICYPLSYCSGILERRWQQG
ncbi:amino acid ABC transporter permease [Chromatiaceae bacterium AAb-1]|nr:amino acid ABC transporter permease [Chromatiaceae bacterium AAb-1]